MSNFSTGHLLRYRRTDRRCYLRTRARYAPTGRGKATSVDIGSVVLVLESTYSRYGSGTVQGESRVLVSCPDRGLIAGWMDNAELSDNFVRVKA